MSRSRPAVPWSQLSQFGLLMLRVLGAGLLAATAGIHLYLWNAGYSTIDWIGPLFLFDVIAAVVLCLAVLAVPRRWLPLAAALGALLQAGTLAALLLAVAVGLFGFVEATQATLFWPSVVVELFGAAVLLALAVVHPGAGAGAAPVRPDR
ncbi:hypothetical protein [Geodermatophilus ruber]|uniref:Uncharacterized protein n=1 Tax=Geodermatophilus ruber TaxID=504800 RepID=A0A1I4KEC4_9ACTN|nr:hypothetical protein [Geodermatophilus ruber]SFL77078.1 hypothetical protein SAMN04488085_11773 [Geodermatophilus ruber]